MAPLKSVVREYAGLTCRVIDALPAGTTPRLGVVFCHGYGASGTDLVPLAQALFQAEPALMEGVQFCFPEAPLSLADMGMPGGRAWWHLSLQRLQQQLTQRRFHEIRETIPDGIDAVRDQLHSALDAWCGDVGLEWSRLVIGGFSQGAMVSVETVATAKTAPAGLIAFSGTLIRESAWRAGLARHTGLPVFQSHGEYDMVLPYIGGVWLKELFEASGHALSFLEFPGGHEIPWEALEGVAAFLRERA